LRDSFHHREIDDNDLVRPEYDPPDPTMELSRDEIMLMFRISGLLFAAYAVLVSVLLMVVIWI